MIENADETREWMNILEIKEIKRVFHVNISKARENSTYNENNPRSDDAEEKVGKLYFFEIM